MGAQVIEAHSVSPLLRTAAWALTKGLSEDQEACCMKCGAQAVALE